MGFITLSKNVPWVLLQRGVPGMSNKSRDPAEGPGHVGETMVFGHSPQSQFPSYTTPVKGLATFTSHFQSARFVGPPLRWWGASTIWSVGCWSTGKQVAANAWPKPHETPRMILPAVLQTTSEPTSFPLSVSSVGYLQSRLWRWFHCPVKKSRPFWIHWWMCTCSVNWTAWCVVRFTWRFPRWRQ